MTVGSNTPLLNVSDLSVGFFSSEKKLGIAVKDIKFTIFPGNIFCLVGESGCGKSVTALCLLRLLPEPPAVILSGSVCFMEQKLFSLSNEELRGVRGNSVGFVFQNPMTSLNPVMRIGTQISEVLMLHKGYSKQEATEATIDLLTEVGIKQASKRRLDFPHQMSGGMRQRVLIAMATACKPYLLIADEPTTALDVTLQGQILLLLKKQIVNSERGMLLISHDFRVVEACADFVAVMYAGEIVEQGSSEEILHDAKHPYTQSLIKSRISNKNLSTTTTENFFSKRGGLHAIPGIVPGLWDRPDGCSFCSRCPKAMPRCLKESPSLFTLQTDPSVIGMPRATRCWLYEK